MTLRVREILDWYRSEPPGVLARLAFLFNHGALAGTGRLFLLSQSSILDSSPEQKYAVYKDSYDPSYQMKLSSELGVSAYSAHVGSIEASAPDFAGECPLILEMNQWVEGEKLVELASVEKALQLGCTAIKINMPTELFDQNINWMQQMISESKKYGLPVLISGAVNEKQLSDTRCIDLISSYCNKAVQLGAHIVNVGLPENQFSQKKQESLYLAYRIKVHKVFDRVKHILDSSFAGQRIVLFSLNETLDAEELILAGKEIARGGGFGTMVSSELWFKYTMQDAVDLNKKIMAHFIR